jgi:hypothetical protein
MEEMEGRIHSGNTAYSKREVMVLRLVKEQSKVGC